MFGLEYIQGYTAALLDVRAVLDDIEYDLKIHKRRQNLKTIRQGVFVGVKPKQLPRICHFS